uniref:Integrin subunit alpha 7 n=1 Tax=Gopherus evgoodei TaxID=1825980 RepID=A0A8C4W8Q7_9SAUR
PPPRPGRAPGSPQRWLHFSLLAGAAFNLDGTDPLLKDGAGGSLFGFSVALHRQLRPEPQQQNGGMLVGAPQALALPGQKANRTGGLYACPLTREIDDCWRVPIDEGGTGTENQWLGVSVKSQGAGGKIVVSGTAGGETPSALPSWVGMGV